METELELLQMLAVGALAVALIVAAVVDLAKRIVPDACVAVVALSRAVWLLAEVFSAKTSVAEAGSELLWSLVGGLVVFAMMAASAWVSVRLRGSVGVGGGDIKLLSAVGLWVGPVMGLFVVALACGLTVLVWGISVFVRRVREGRHTQEGSSVAISTELPLAPGIAVSGLMGAIACIVWGV